MSRDINKLSESYAVLDLFGLLPVIEEICDGPELLRFAKDHSIDIEDMNEGLSQVMKGTLDSHLRELDLNIVLGLESDMLYDRSRNAGVEYQKRKRRTPHGRFVYDLFGRVREMKRSAKVSNVTDAYKEHLLEYVSDMGSIFDSHVSIDARLTGYTGPRDVLNRISVFWFFENVLSSRSPHMSYFMGPLAETGKRTHIGKIIGGVGRVVAFIFSKVYDPMFGSNLADTFMSITDLHQYMKACREVKDKIIDVVRSEFGIDLPVFNISQPVNTKQISIPPQPKTDERNLTNSERLDEFYYHYPLELVYSGKRVHSGPAAFVRLVEGEMKLSGATPIHVVKIKHPREDLGNDYSFGVLITSMSSFYDASGWLVFVSCSHDYGIDNSILHARLEKFLEDWNGNVIIKEGEISEEALRRYANLESSARPLVPSRTEGLEWYLSKSRRVLDDASALLLELIVVLHQAMQLTPLRWALRDSTLGDMEVDVVSPTASECLMFECSHRLSADDREEAKILVDEFSKKVSALSSISQCDTLTVKPVFMTRFKHIANPSLKITLRELGNAGIDVQSIEDMIQALPVEEEDKQRLQQIILDLDSMRTVYRND